MTSDEKRLLKLYRALSERARASLLDYADFLAARDNAPEASVSETPLAIPRPVEESVIKAIKRLRHNYPMLERDKLLNETSALLTKHVVHKHPAAEVIDELEALFKHHYDLHVQAKQDQTT
ncbi:hypothetical protein EZJ19_09705 [Parasulfuritortus cantonensis]|uniref:Crp/Fnr family transcriptional regulator n=1 Tax=Parasulfuritortus cantonensis TaxID=2528202 RepID=A0A4R1BAE7_9PROT|nr:hypothetical protein [Parasulfuritortus cantonensis]TCJ13919.1 hypothetical protein EZJ19_09705 [Parasulfuritortus cantonensis]